MGENVVLADRYYRHKKTGRCYQIARIGKMQSAKWKHKVRAWRGPLYTERSVDMEEVVIYISMDDADEYWVRPKEEFFDGRFEEISEDEITWSNEDE